MSTATERPRRKLCALKDCPEHRGDPEWTPIRSSRGERPVLRVVRP